MRLAVFTDDDSEADLICGVLAGAGHACQRNRIGEHLTALTQDSVDLIVMSGRCALAAGLLSTIRQNMPAALPVLLIASRAEENDIAAAMSAGANDYLLRPIRRPELLTRVHVLFQRAYPDWNQREQIRFGPYLFETATAQISLAGRNIEMTQKEFELALLFFRNVGRPLSRAYILDMVWSREGNVPSRTMDTHVSRVRNKLQLRPENGFRLTPVYSYGYRLEQVDNPA